GAVMFEGWVAYEPGRNLDYYIQQAGGYAANADESRVSITGPDGRRQVVARGLLRGTPVPPPGSEMFVPELVAGQRTGMSWGDVLTRTAAVASPIATLIFARPQLRQTVRQRAVEEGREPVAARPPRPVHLKPYDIRQDQERATRRHLAARTRRLLRVTTLLALDSAVALATLFLVIDGLSGTVVAALLPVA